MVQQFLVSVLGFFSEKKYGMKFCKYAQENSCSTRNAQFEMRYATVYTLSMYGFGLNQIYKLPKNSTQHLFLCHSPLVGDWQSPLSGIIKREVLWSCPIMFSVIIFSPAPFTFWSALSWCSSQLFNQECRGLSLWSPGPLIYSQGFNDYLYVRTPKSVFLTRDIFLKSYLNIYLFTLHLHFVLQNLKFHISETNLICLSQIFSPFCTWPRSEW